MKICKFCQAELADELTVCSVCGAELESEEAPVVEEVAEEVVETAPAKKKNTGAIVIGVLAVVLAALVALFFVLRGRDQAPVETPEEGEYVEAELQPAHHVNAYGYNSHAIHYTKAEDGSMTYDYMDADGNLIPLTQEEVDALLDAVVATCGDTKLTNRQIMYYYNEQYYSFSNTYGMYLTMMMDPSKALDEQLSMDGVNTWEQSFVTGAVDMFQQMVAVAAKGKAEGFEPEESVDKMAEDMLVQMNEMAAQYGYPTTNDYVVEAFGPGATVESYVEFYKLNTYAVAYINAMIDAMEITDEEANEYFDNNSEYLQSQGLTKTDLTNVNVRHILVQPEQTTAEDGTTSISDEAWAAAEAEANRLYEEWKNGEATEDSFAALATANTQDAGSQSTGGLYENVYPGQMVTEFNDWCFDAARQTGDTAVVKTSYGYHIMFFVTHTDEIYWRTVVDEQIKNERINAELVELQEANPVTSDFAKVILFSSAAPTSPEAEAAAEENLTSEEKLEKIRENETERDYGDDAVIEGQ